MKVLVAEDDIETADYIAQGLRELGHSVEVAGNGRDGLFLATDGSYDLLIVDRMLPVLDGLVLVKTLRGAKIQTPVLFLTTLGGIDDRVEGLDAGGDDYLVKPFAVEELLARTRALIRRGQGRASNDLEVDGLRLSPARRVAWLDGEDLGLSVREFQVLLALAARYPDPVEKRELEKLLYGWDEHGSANAIEVHVHNLRRKMSADWIETRRSVGYRLSPRNS